MGYDEWCRIYGMVRLKSLCYNKKEMQFSTLIEIRQNSLEKRCMAMWVVIILDKTKMWGYIDENEIDGSDYEQEQRV